MEGLKVKIVIWNNSRFQLKCCRSGCVIQPFCALNVNNHLTNCNTRQITF